MRPPDEIANALAQPCVADNTLLVNFMHAGAAQLLRDLLRAPVRLTPTVLDPAEASLPDQAWDAREAASEFLRPLHRAAEAERQAARGSPPSDLPYYRRVAPLIAEFAAAEGAWWTPVSVTPAELARGAYLASRQVRQEARRAYPDLRGRVELDAGEAETVAVAAARGWTILVDDQAAVNLLRRLHPNVPIVRTCELLAYAATTRLIACAEAGGLFNRVMVEELGFYARRQGRRLVLRCGPPRCCWE